jgi:hypothetical protein
LINAIGYIKFNHIPKESIKYKENVTDSINNLSDRKNTFKVHSVSEPFVSMDNIVVEVKCVYSVHLHRNDDCKILNDYVGKISDHVKHLLPVRGYPTVQIHNISYVKDETKFTTFKDYSVDDVIKLFKDEYEDENDLETLF